MPQMLPCSWLFVFLGSVISFLIINSSWSAFFFISSFPKKKNSSSLKKSIFWF